MVWVKIIRSWIKIMFLLSAAIGVTSWGSKDRPYRLVHGSDNVLSTLKKLLYTQIMITFAMRWKGCFAADTIRFTEPRSLPISPFKPDIPGYLSEKGACKDDPDLPCCERAWMIFRNNEEYNATVMKVYYSTGIHPDSPMPTNTKGFYMQYPNCKANGYFTSLQCIKAAETPTETTCCCSDKFGNSVQSLIYGPDDSPMLTLIGNSDKRLYWKTGRKVKENKHSPIPKKGVWPWIPVNPWERRRKPILIGNGDKRLYWKPNKVESGRKRTKEEEKRQMGMKSDSMFRPGDSKFRPTDVLLNYLKSQASAKTNQAARKTGKGNERPICYRTPLPVKNMCP